MMSPMNGRLVVAACLVLAGLAGSALTAVAQPDERFGTPAVQPGDRWLYNATGAVPASPPYQPQATWSLGRVAFQAGPAVDAMDGHGQPHAARQLDELREYRYGDGDEPSIITAPSWHAVAGAETVATTAVVQFASGGRGEINGPVNVTGGDFHVQTHTDASFGEAAPLCGHAHGLQGVQADLDDGVVLHGACRADAWEGSDVTVTLPHNGTAAWRGRTVQAFAAGGLEAWLDAAIPVPVFLRLGNATFDLVGYEGAAVPEARAFHHQEAPPVAFAVRTATGPDETGVAHPFPLSAAFAAALADGGSGLAGYMAAHPDAQVVAASFHEIADDTGTRREWRERWTFTASDGVSAHGVQSELVLLGPMGAPPLPPQSPVERPPPMAPFPAAAQAFQQPESVPIDPVHGPWPAPGEIPGEMPTVASLFSRWDAYKADGRGAGQAWGFSAACGTDSCAEGGWRTWAGLARTTYPFDVCVSLVVCVSTEEPEVSTLEVDGAGATTRHREVTMHREETFDVGLFAPASTPRPSSQPPAASLVASLPAPATTIGAIATLAALLVLAWPWLKAGGPLALFSRVSDDRVLDSPRRAALLGLIEAEPGIHLRELARRTGQAEGALRHHLALLQQAGKLRAVRGPRYLCYFPLGGAAVDRQRAAAAPLLKSDVARRLLERCAAEPGQSGQRLARELGVTPGAVTYHVQRLSAAGLLQQRRLGREQLVDVTPLGRAAV